MSFNKKLGVNILFLLMINLVIKPFWIFGIDRHLQNSISTESYGAYFAVFNFSFLLYILLDGGINNYNTINLSQNKEHLNKQLSDLFYFKLILSILYFTFTFAFTLATHFSSEQLELLAILALNMVLLNLVLFFRSTLSALQFFKTDGIVSVLDRILSIVFCSILIYIKQFTILHFLLAQTTALLCTLAISMFVVNKIGKPSWKKPDVSTCIPIIKKIYPFAILGIIMTLYYRLDGVMIEQLLPDGKAQAGIYAASYRLLDAYNNVSYLVSGILLSVFAKYIAERNIEKLKKIIWGYGSLLLLVSTAVFLICYIYADTLLHLLYIHADASWVSVFRWLMLSAIPISLTYVFGTFLTANRSLFILNSLSLGALLINILLNLWLIPKYKADGACKATAITQFVVILTQVIIVFYFLHKKPNYIQNEKTT